MTSFSQAIDWKQKAKEEAATLSTLVRAQKFASQQWKEAIENYKEVKKQAEFTFEILEEKTAAYTAAEAARETQEEKLREVQQKAIDAANKALKETNQKEKMLQSMLLGEQERSNDEISESAHTAAAAPCVFLIAPPVKHEPYNRVARACTGGGGFHVCRKCENKNTVFICIYNEYNNDPQIVVTCRDCGFTFEDK